MAAWYTTSRLPISETKIQPDNISWVVLEAYQNPHPLPQLETVDKCFWSAKAVQIQICQGSFGCPLSDQGDQGEGQDVGRQSLQVLRQSQAQKDNREPKVCL